MSVALELKDSDGDQLRIWDEEEGRVTLIVIDREDDSKRQPVYVTEEDAPAVALAILKGSGYSGTAVVALGADLAERRARAEQAELDEHALTLLNTLRTSNGYSGLSDDHLDTRTANAWRNVTRKAKEIFGGDK